MEPSPKVNILLVDDQPAKLLSYEVILGSLNENLVTASSGREALEHLLKQEFAVILVDVCMPEQDGFELVEMIRSHYRFKRTAIIFVSAIQMSEMDFIKGYASGAVDYVSVPIVPEILRAKVGVFVDLFRKTKQLEVLNAELEERVLERTSRLSETEEALREANRRKDAFLATLAHELRNPLAPIRSALDLLKRTPDLREAAEAVLVMDRQLDQMTRLVDDLMDLSRINRGKLELRKARTDAATVVLGAIETAQPSIESANQELRHVMVSEDIQLEADPARLSQVISNLLLNASKYTKSGGTILCEVTREGGDLILRVADNGVGIARSELSRVFEPFYQVHAAGSAFDGGLGIGLTLVRTIVEMHGGEVTISSEGLGSGSEFTVRLPCVVETLVEPERANKPTMQCAPKRILVVDDNRDAAEILAMLLSKQTHHVEVAYNGKQAIEKAEELLPHLIVMDLGMPDMDGLEAAREIRSRSWGKGILIAAVTGWGQADDREKSREAGFDKHFVKPVPYAELEKLLFELDESATTQSTA